MIVDDTVAGFYSVLHQPHPDADNLRRAHRFVILPDFQGLGLGLAMQNIVARHYIETGFRFSIVTSNPAIVAGLRRDPAWTCKMQGRQRPSSIAASTLATVAPGRYYRGANQSSTGRITSSWEYRPDSAPRRAPRKRRRKY